jgi:DNA-binding NtrC family response regulator
MAGAISVLVVVGDQTTRLGLEQVLRRENFAPVSVSTIAEALPLLPAAAILLFDPIFPDGFDSSILAQIAAQKLPIRVGIISSISPKDPRLVGQKFDAFFEKPITREKLDALVAWLKRP